MDLEIENEEEIDEVSMIRDSINVAENVTISDQTSLNVESEVTVENAKVLKVGDKFSSFDSLMSKVKEYEQAVFNNFWIRDSRTLENQARRFPNGIAARGCNELKYYYLKYSCLKGGRNYKARNKVRETMTFRQGCAASMYVKLSECGKFLEIKEMNECHNHETSKPLFDTVKNQRLNISEDLKTACREALNVRGNKKIIQDQIIAKTGCQVTLRDLSNMKDPAAKNKKNFEDCINILKNTYGCDVEILCDDNGNLLGVYFQDKIMQKMFESFPEIIFVDGTYCLHVNKAATYVILIEDSHGNGAVAAVGILCKEDDGTLDWFVQTFLKKNAHSDKVQVIMSDKDSTERSVFSRHFPNAKLIICLFHTFQIFNREISPKNMPGMNQEQCDSAKEYFQKLAYSSSEEKYFETLTEMRKNVAKPALDYFDKNWSDIKEQWVLCYTFANQSFLNKTNNKLENFNQKLKGVILRYSDLDDFIKYFFVTINSMRVNQNVNSAKELHKVPTHKYPPGSTEEMYQKLLTTFAFEKVLAQLKRIDACKDDVTILNEEECLVPTSEGLLEVRKDKCECLFFKSIKLPCRHIFKVRSTLGIPLYDESICLQRWKKSYFTNHHPFFDAKESILDQQKESDTEVIVTQTQTLTKKRNLTNHEKFKLMNDKFLTMAHICSEVSSEIFYHRLEFIENLCDQWLGTLREENQENDDVDTSEAYAGSFSKDHFYCKKSFVGNAPASISLTDDDIDVIDKASCDHHDSSNDLVDQENILLENVKVPTNLKPRGRPKGMGNTVIGLKRKKAKKKLSKKQENKLNDEFTVTFVAKKQKSVLGEINSN